MVSDVPRDAACAACYRLHMRAAGRVDGVKWECLFMPAGPIFARKLCGGANASGMLFNPEAFSPERKQPMLQPAEAPPWQVSEMQCRSPPLLSIPPPSRPTRAEPRPDCAGADSEREC